MNIVKSPSIIQANPDHIEGSQTLINWRRCIRPDERLFVYGIDGCVTAEDHDRTLKIVTVLTPDKKLLNVPFAEVYPDNPYIIERLFEEFNKVTPKNRRKREINTLLKQLDMWLLERWPYLKVHHLIPTED